jgi:uncharacterized protein (DUF58 family)
MSQFINSSELAALLYGECRALQFRAKKWAEEQTSGGYRSIAKGSGMEFDEARLYVPGDDSRRIDWKLTARKSSTYVKSFIEERDVSVSLLIDISNSSLLGSRITLIERLLEVSAFLSSIALHNKDVISACIFDSIIRTRIKPSKSPSSVFRILFSIIDAINSSSTEISKHPFKIKNILDECSHSLKRRSIIFLISDFKYPTNYHSSLKFLSQKHELYAIWLADTIEPLLALGKLTKIYDPETGEESICDLSNKKVIEKLRHAHQEHQTKLTNLFNSSGTRFTKIEEADEARNVLTSFLLKESRKTRSR